MLFFFWYRFFQLNFSFFHSVPLITIELMRLQNSKELLFKCFSNHESGALQVWVSRRGFVYFYFIHRLDFLIHVHANFADDKQT